MPTHTKAERRKNQANPNLTEKQRRLVKLVKASGGEVDPDEFPAITQRIAKEAKRATAKRPPGAGRKGTGS